MAFTIPDAQIHDFAVNCKGCKATIPSLVQTMPASWIRVRCSLCHGEFRYLPSDVFRGRLSYKLADQPRKKEIATLPPGKVINLVAARVQKRIASLNAVRLDGIDSTVHELQLVLDLLQRAERYILDQHQRRQITGDGNHG
jgi:hypothetical protein